MRRKKKSPLLPILLFSGVLAVSILALILAQKIRQNRIQNPGTVSNQDEIPRVTADEAFEAQSAGEAILVDTRSEAEYQTSHVAGAINLPVSQAEARLSELDPDAWYLTYCT